MRAGRLRTKISFYALTSTRDEYSGFTDAFTWDFDTWAQVIYISGHEGIVNEQVFAGKSLTFEIRYRTGVVETSRVKFNDVFYNIQSIENVDARNRTLMINTEKVSE